MYSIYHFWKHLIRNKTSLMRVGRLEKFKFDYETLSCKNVGVFPDLAIKLNKDRSVFTGGELIELKDSKSYVVSSFNSTIPTGKKNIRKIIPSENSTTFVQMKNAGDDVFSLEERDVYYLVRGKRGGHQKICLVHGSFFETIGVNELIPSLSPRCWKKSFQAPIFPTKIGDGWKRFFRSRKISAA